MNKKTKDKNTIDLFEIIIDMWNEKLIISMLILFLVSSSLFFFYKNDYYKPTYEISIPYYIEVVPSEIDKKCVSKKYNCFRSLLNFDLNKYMKEKFKIKTKVLKEKILIKTKKMKNYSNFFEKYNNYITTKTLNDEKTEINFLNKEYNKLGVNLQENQEYINEIIKRRRIIHKIENGLKIYKFEKIITFKNQINVFVVILVSILSGMIIGMFYVTEKKIIVHL